MNLYEVTAKNMREFAELSLPKEIEKEINDILNLIYERSKLGYKRISYLPNHKVEVCKELINRGFHVCDLDIIGKIGIIWE